MWLRESVKQSEMEPDYDESWCVPAKVTSRCEQSLHKVLIYIQ